MAWTLLRKQKSLPKVATSEAKAKRLGRFEMRSKLFFNYSGCAEGVQFVAGTSLASADLFSSRFCFTHLRIDLSDQHLLPMH